MKKENILISGASGQIGTVLTHALVDHYGVENVIATDIKEPSYHDIDFVVMDILNVQRMSEIIDDYRITQIYHLAAILSANGEWNPAKTWNVNMNGLLSVLNLCHEKGIRKLFFPSTIAVFGGPSPKYNTPQHAPMIPSTVYGVSKVAGELWCHYYHRRYGLDVRSIRYPGIISHHSMPGGGTTDYAVDIFHEALQTGGYTCALTPDTRLPMIYMPDAIRATIELMEAPEEKIGIRTGYNLSSMDFTPAELAAEIQNHLPDFTIDYEPDANLQGIADSWPHTIDDSQAREDWGWQPKYDLAAMTQDMIMHLARQYER